MEIYTKLKEARTRAGLIQEEAAERIESEDAESDRAESETETESEEIGKQKSGGWFWKLFGKK